MTKLTIKIADNRQLSKEDFSPIPNITNKVADKTLAFLESEGIFVFPELIKDAQDVTREQMILQSNNENYCASNVMGFLGFGQERLLIESRFATNHHDYFFQYLLEKVLDFPNIIDLTTDSSNEEQIFNLLIFLFPHYLQLALRKGEFKTYILNNYNDHNVKGTIDIGRHIKQNTPFVGKIAYNQREFSYDNYLMEIIRHTIEFIKQKPYGSTILSKVNDEVKSVVSVTQKYELHNRRKIINSNKKMPIRHAYYHEYRALQRLCIMILQFDKHNIGGGINQINGILFDGAWLWEEYVNLLIGETFYHPMNKGNKGAQWLFSSENSKVGLIYPDFISKDNVNMVIADAKYKPATNIGNQDYLQLLAYMFRFDAKKGFYLYPESNEQDSTTLMLNNGSSYEKNVSKRDDISITKHGLKIPSNAESYEDFANKISINEKLFVDALNFK